MRNQLPRIEGDFPAMEQLEDRLLLSTSPGPVVIGDGAGADAKSLVYFDADGTQVTVALKGGTATVNWGAGGTATPDWTVNTTKTMATVGSAAAPVDIFLVELAGTTLKSALTFTTVKPLRSQADLFAQILGGIVSATPIGTITAPKITIASGFNNGAKQVAISVTGATTVAVGGVVSGALDFGGAAADKLAFTANGAIGSSDLTFAGTITQLALSAGWAGGTVTAGAIAKVTSTGDLACGLAATAGAIGPVTVTGGSLSGAELSATGGIGAITVKNGDLTADLHAGGSIGAISVTGGDLTGSIISTDGAIGAITVTGVAAWTPDPDDRRLGQGEVQGGNILSPQIHANVVKGRSIGNITVTAGNFESADQPVDIRSVKDAGTALAGSIGAIVVKSLRYKELADLQEVTDPEGNSVLDRNGDPVMRVVTTFAFQGGGINATLDTSGKVGNLTTSGGDLAGTIHAAGGIGDVKVESIVQHSSGTMAGVTIASSETDILAANLTASLSAEPGAAAMGIKSLSFLGGTMSGAVEVLGKVGPINSKCIGLYDGSTLTLDGGGLSSENFHASAIGAINLGGGGLTGNLLADGSIGAITVLVGVFTGSVTATTGSVGNISVKGFGIDLLDPEICNFNAFVTAGRTIGTVTVEGGNLSGILTAWSGIGAITAKALTVNATGRWVGTPMEGETDWEFDPTPSIVFGGTLEVTINLGGSSDNMNAAAKLGQVLGVGSSVHVNGTVPWNPANAKLACRKISYIESVDGEERTNDNGDVIGHVATRTTAWLPGEDDVATYVNNELAAL